MTVTGCEVLIANYSNFDASCPSPNSTNQQTKQIVEWSSLQHHYLASGIISGHRASGIRHLKKSY